MKQKEITIVIDEDKEEMVRYALSRVIGVVDVKD